jgi:hypothetical protein
VGRGKHSRYSRQGIAEGIVPARQLTRRARPFPRHPYSNNDQRATRARYHEATRSQVMSRHGKRDRSLR